MTTKYTASLEIKLITGGDKDEASQDVTYKPDGHRFATSDSTLKMLVDCHYEFRLSIRPATPLHSVRVHDTPVTIVDLSGPETGCTYAFKWTSTGVSPDKRGKRTTLNLSLQFQGSVSLNLPLQVKFYPDPEHLACNIPLHDIQFECECDSNNCLEVVKTLFHRQAPRLNAH